MNAAGQGDGEETAGGGDDQRQRLAGVSANEFWLMRGVLVKGLDCRHFQSGLGDLDPVGQEHQAAVDGEHEGLERR